MIVNERRSVRNGTRVVSIVMFWACSSRRASRRKAYSNSIPSALQAASIRSAFPSGTEWVSKRSRPIRVDLPWSTWPTTTSCRWSEPAGAAAGAGAAAVGRGDAVEGGAGASGTASIIAVT